MAVAPPLQLLDEITDFLASSPPPQEIIDFTPSEALRNRSLELLQRNRERTLSEAERAEMADFIRMDHFMTILKAKARLRLGKS